MRDDDAPTPPEHPVVALCWSRLRIEGQVQGVGFRPFVHRLARELKITGSIHNDLRGVTVEAWGTAEGLADLQERVRRDAPALARVDRVLRVGGGTTIPGVAPSEFRIASSEAAPGGQRGRVTVDAAVCADCLRELGDPSDRRYRHPLINCTSCGPRYTIVRDLPYDRSRTTMAPFPMCPRCEAEYRSPADRRFHAQPVCCHSCGPALLLDTRDRVVEARSPAEVEAVFAEVAAALSRGGIVAMKGLGGYHLVADGTDAGAVGRLRALKRRAHKPFALLVADLSEARALCRLSGRGAALLGSPASPIVIAPWRADRRGVPGKSPSDPVPQNAPGHERLGLMLPNTPMQHLLVERLHRPLVMTSANVADEPLVTDPGEARRRFGRGVDAYLEHDRAIERAVDDSVLVDAGEALDPLPLRRARGYVPAPITLAPAAARPGVCTGADLKSAVAVVRGRQAIVSQHVGDLDHALAFERFRRTLEDLQRLFDVRPDWVAVDLHPSYAARRWGVELARRGVGRGPLALVEVQHHHAHLASLLAEHGHEGPVVGIVCDGVGWGADATAWGGEILVGGLTRVRRVAHLRPVRLPGGDEAARTIGRCAISWLVDALGPEAAAAHPMARAVMPDERTRRAVLTLLACDLRCPPSTGAGRLFDAAASILGLCDRNHYEAMSGELLESAALRSTARPSGDERIALTDGSPRILDHRPLLRELVERRVRGEPPEDLAWLFHDALADGLARAAVAAAGEAGLDTVGLSGGVFCNVVLTLRVYERLARAGLRVLTHREVPPNDGGIALGQAAIAAATLPGAAGESR